MIQFPSLAAYQRRKGGLSEDQMRHFNENPRHIQLDDTAHLQRILSMDNLYLEVGFGTGDYLLKHAQDNPNIQHVGIDLYRHGLARVLQQADQLCLHNLHVLCVDAYRFLHQPPYPCNGSFSVINIFHPDPWPKKRHHKRRLCNAETLKAAYALLHIEGSLHILSDDPSYTEHIADIVQSLFPMYSSHTAGVSARTKYGEKAVSEGRSIHEFIITKR